MEKFSTTLPLPLNCSCSRLCKYLALLLKSPALSGYAGAACTPESCHDCSTSPSCSTPPWAGRSGKAREVPSILPGSPCYPYAYRLHHFSYMLLSCRSIAIAAGTRCWSRHHRQQRRLLRLGFNYLEPLVTVSTSDVKTPCDGSIRAGSVGEPPRRRAQPYNVAMVAGRLAANPNPLGCGHGRVHVIAWSTSVSSLSPRTTPAMSRAVDPPVSAEERLAWASFGFGPASPSWAWWAR